MSILKLIDNVVTTLASSYLIGSSSFLQLTRTTIKSWMGLKFGRIRSGIYELAALELLENLHRLTMGDLLVHSSAFNFELIFFILADKKDNYKSLNGLVFLQDPITYYGVSCP